MAMWTVTVMVAGQVQHPILQYTAMERATENAEKAMRTTDVTQFATPAIALTDDYGRTLLFELNRVDMVLVQDVDHALEGDNIVRLKQAQSESRLQKQASLDPTMRNSSLVQMQPTGRAS